MSWGFFVDLKLRVARPVWTKLLETRAGDVAIDASWTGLEEQELSESFFFESFAEQTHTLGDVLGWDDLAPLKTIDHEGGKTDVRIAAALDRSQLDLVAYLGALFEAAREAGGEGTLALVNDGTYVGEAGVVHTIAGGERTIEPIEDGGPYVEDLGAAIFGALELPNAPKAKQAPARKSSAAKKKSPATNKAPKTKKAPAKKSSAKKSSAKKSPVTKSPAKKSPVKKKSPATKSAPAKKGPAKKKGARLKKSPANKKATKKR